MNADQLRAQLGQSSFLRDLSEAHVDKLAELARWREYAPQAVIFREGDPPTSVYVIESGRVGLEICAPGIGCRRILTAAPGDLLGWSPVLGESRLTATARALEPTTCFEFKAGQVLAACEHDAAFGYAFMRRLALEMAKRLNATRMQLMDVFGTHMPEAEAKTGA
jgi:CRP-like cAMP-binding protein